MNQTERIRYAKEVERINRKYEEAFFPSVLRALLSKVRAVISRLRDGGTDEAIRYLDANIGNPALAERVRMIYRIVGLRHANRVFGELRRQQRERVKRFGFNEEWAANVENYLRRFLLEKITFAVDQTLRDRIMEVLMQGVNEGIGVDEMVKRLEGLPFLRYQTARIVRTEIKRAGEAGAREASKTFEYEQNKIWISLHDNRVRGVDPKDRADHRGLDGQTVDENEPFRDPRNGAQLQFPGDPDAGAVNTINCRCTVGYVARRDERGRLIPKQRRSRVSVILPGQFNQPRQTVLI